LLPYPLLDNIVKGYIEFHIDNFPQFKNEYVSYVNKTVQSSSREFEKFTINDFTSSFVIDKLKRIFNFENPKLMELDKTSFDRIIRLIYVNEFKRRQSAPGIKISERAFGTGRRLPITANYKYLG
jgi:NH3-dependent NAD+ synthetase